MRPSSVAVQDKERHRFSRCQDFKMVKGKNANEQSSSDANSEGSHPTVQRQLLRTAKQKHAAAEQERLRNVEKSTAALAKEAIRVGDTQTCLQDEAARGEITMREANIMRIAERDRIAKLQEWADKVGADEEEMREMVATVDPVQRPRISRLNHLHKPRLTTITTTNMVNSRKRRRRKRTTIPRLTTTTTTLMTPTTTLTTTTTIMMMTTTTMTTTMRTTTTTTMTMISPTQTLSNLPSSSLKSLNHWLSNLWQRRSP